MNSTPTPTTTLGQLNYDLDQHTECLHYAEDCLERHMRQHRCWQLSCGIRDGLRAEVRTLTHVVDGARARRDKARAEAEAQS